MTEAQATTEQAGAEAADPSTLFANLLKAGLPGASTDGAELKSVVEPGFTTAQDWASTYNAESRLASALTTMVSNLDLDNISSCNSSEFQEVIALIDQKISKRMNEVLKHDNFRNMERNWRSLDDLVRNIDHGSNVEISMLDASKDELGEDLDVYAVDIGNSATFSKIYTDEYDQYGGKPFGATIGLYEFENTPDDINWLDVMGKISNAAHCPFISAVSPKFFGFETAAETAEIKDLTTMMRHPKYARWNKFRDSEHAAYVGLTFPHYVLRLPYHPETNPCKSLDFTEDAGGEDAGYLWGNAATLMARNMADSFVKTGWCQYIRGPRGGGAVDGLPAHSYEFNGESKIKEAVEVTIPDYRELEFAKAGFMPLVHKKDGVGEATFFSVQSTKRVHEFKDPKDSENSQLVSNLAYTMSITRIAHYVRTLMRERIGSEANANSIRSELNNWLSNYVTTVKDPNDLTMRIFPFKAAKIEVNEREGQIGVFDSTISVLPHLQFEGIDVELRVESRLGAAG